MADRLREQEMRLTIPAAGEFRVLATELAGKFAEYSGRPLGTRRSCGARRAAGGEADQWRGAGRLIDLDMVVRANVLVVRLSSGSKSDETTCPLSD